MSKHSIKLQWALAGLLEQQRVVSDRLVMQRICHGEFKVGAEQ